MLVQLNLENHDYQITKTMLKGKKLTCRIVRQFSENCNDNGFKKLKFTIFDCLNNVDGLTDDEIDDLLLKKEKFWIKTLVM